MIDLSPWKRAVAGLGALAILVIASWAAGAVFHLTLKAPIDSARPWTFPLLVLHHHANPALHKNFVFSWIAGIAVFLIPTVMFIEALRDKIPLHGSARFARLGEIKKAKLLGDDGILIGRMGKRLLRSPGHTHVILSAPTGSGKGVSMVIPNLLSWPESTVTLDVKGENYQLTAGFRAAHGIDCFFFNPVAEDERTHRYNPLGYISEDPHQRLNDIQKIASFLFPDMDGQDPIWNASSRGLFLGTVLLILETGAPCTMAEVLRQVTSGEDAGVYFTRIINERAAKGTPLSRSCTRALADFIGTSDNTRTSIRKTFTSRLELWFNPMVDAATSTNDFDLRDLRRKRMSIYFGVTPDNLDRLAPLTNLFFQQAIDLNTRVLPEHDKSLKLTALFILDEFANFGAMRLVVKGISYVRGYHLRLLTILQSPAQLKAIYGDDNARTYITNNSVQVHFRPSAQEDADSLSKALGTQTFKSKSRSRQFGMRGGGSESTSDQPRPLMLPQELKKLDERTSIIFADEVPYPMKVTKIWYFEEKAFLERLRPAPVVPRLDFSTIPNSAGPAVPCPPDGGPALASAAPASTNTPRATFAAALAAANAAGGTNEEIFEAAQANIEDALAALLSDESDPEFTNAPPVTGEASSQSLPEPGAPATSAAQEQEV